MNVIDSILLVIQATILLFFFASPLYVGLVIGIETLIKYRNNKFIAFFLTPVVYYATIAGVLWFWYFYKNPPTMVSKDEITPVLNMYEKDLFWSIVIGNSVIFVFFIVSNLKNKWLFRIRNKIDGGIKNNECVRFRFINLSCNYVRNGLFNSFIYGNIYKLKYFKKL